jgi:hypothetical protein
MRTNKFAFTISQMQVFCLSNEEANQQVRSCDDGARHVAKLLRPIKPEIDLQVRREPPRVFRPTLPVIAQQGGGEQVRKR